VFQSAGCTGVYFSLKKNKSNIRTIVMIENNASFPGYAEIMRRKSKQTKKH
jgi:hypothetical protein